MYSTARKKNAMSRFTEIAEVATRHRKVIEFIPYVKVGKCLRFPIKAIEQWEKQKTTRAS